MTHAEATDPLRELARSIAASLYPAHDGRFVVVGLRGGAPLLAFAAGVGSEDQKDRLAVLARHVLAHRGADGYLVMMPADLGDREVLAVECFADGRRGIQALAVERNRSGGLAIGGPARALDEQSPLMGELLAPGAPLPGILRRELDRAYEALRIELPRLE